MLSLLRKAGVPSWETLLAEWPHDEIAELIRGEGLASTDEQSSEEGFAGAPGHGAIVLVVPPAGVTIAS